TVLQSFDPFPDRCRVADVDDREGLRPHVLACDAPYVFRGDGGNAVAVVVVVVARQAVGHELRECTGELSGRLHLQRQDADQVVPRVRQLLVAHALRAQALALLQHFLHGADGDIRADGGRYEERPGPAPEGVLAAHAVREAV